MVFRDHGALYLCHSILSMRVNGVLYSVCSLYKGASLKPDYDGTSRLSHHHLPVPPPTLLPLIKHSAMREWLLLPDAALFLGVAGLCFLERVRSKEDSDMATTSAGMEMRRRIQLLLLVANLTRYGRRHGLFRELRSGMCDKHQCGLRLVLGSME